MADLSASSRASSAASSGASSAQGSIDRSLAAAGYQEGYRHRQQSHRIFIATICREEAARPVHSHDGRHHHARDEERAHACQETETDSYSAHEFRKSGGGEPQPCRSHEPDWRVAGDVCFEARAVEAAQNFLRAVRNHHGRQSQTDRHCKPVRRRGDDSSKHFDLVFDVDYPSAEIVTFVDRITRLTKMNKIHA